MATRNDTSPPQKVRESGYTRGLSVRMIRMMALGGAIGTGLFYGSGTAISMAGPAILLVFAVAGLAVLIISRALGELLDYRPTSGSLYEYPHEFLGPFAGFLAGWTYWFTVSIGCAAEVTAAGEYLRYWWPMIPAWAGALAFLAIILAINVLSARVYGETEFWFVTVKTATILVFILGGLWAIMPLPDSASSPITLPHASISNLWNDGGFFPQGGWILLSTVPLALFAYAGFEQVGLTAEEAVRPQRTLRIAVASIPVRIGLFYLGALAVLLCIRGWRTYQAGQSPFVAAMSDASVPYAAAIVNFVVLTAAASSCNSGMYSTGRLLRALSLRGYGPAAVTQLSRRAVPARALLLSATVMVMGVGISTIAAETAWIALISLATIGLIIVWSSLLAAHVSYRRKVARGSVAAATFRLPCAPWTTMCAALVLASVVVEQCFSASGRVVLASGAIWTLFLAAWYGIRKKQQKKANDHV